MLTRQTKSRLSCSLIGSFSCLSSVSKLIAHAYMVIKTFFFPLFSSKLYAQIRCHCTLRPTAVHSTMVLLSSKISGRYNTTKPHLNTEGGHTMPLLAVAGWLSFALQCIYWSTTAVCRCSFCPVGRRSAVYRFIVSLSFIELSKFLRYDIFQSLSNDIIVAFEAVSNTNT